MNKNIPTIFPVHLPQEPLSVATLLGEWKWDNYFQYMECSKPPTSRDIP